LPDVVQPTQTASATRVLGDAPHPCSLGPRHGSVQAVVRVTMHLGVGKKAYSMQIDEVRIMFKTKKTNKILAHSLE